MRLLSTKTLQLSDFAGHRTPRYAILSHRWGDDEISYHDLRYLVETDENRRAIIQAVYNVSHQKAEGKGFTKILRACSMAIAQDFEWIWIDTCCINKESSSELSEAVNSMFKWYNRAEKCYAYLADVKADDGSKNEFQTSDWFRR